MDTIGWMNEKGWRTDTSAGYRHTNPTREGWTMTRMLMQRRCTSSGQESRTCQHLQTTSADKHLFPASSGSPWCTTGADLTSHLICDVTFYICNHQWYVFFCISTVTSLLKSILDNSKRFVESSNQRSFIWDLTFSLSSKSRIMGPTRNFQDTSLIFSNN